MPKDLRKRGFVLNLARLRGKQTRRHVLSRKPIVTCLRGIQRLGGHWVPRQSAPLLNTDDGWTGLETAQSVSTVRIDNSWYFSPFLSSQITTALAQGSPFGPERYRNRTLACCGMICEDSVSVTPLSGLCRVCGLCGTRSWGKVKGSTHQVREAGACN